MLISVKDLKDQIDRFPDEFMLVAHYWSVDDVEQVMSDEEVYLRDDDDNRIDDGHFEVWEKVAPALDESVERCYGDINDDLKNSVLEIL